MKAIACVDKNMGLGFNGDLIIKSKKDMDYFKRITTGHAVVMGRATFESIGSKPLKNRINIVISSNPVENKDVISFTSIIDFLASKYNNKDTFIIGGASIYKQFLPYINEIYLTEVDVACDADVFFPQFRDKFTLVEKQFVKDSDLTMEFCKYDRIKFDDF